jgi:ATP-dependent DNA helicase RecG
MVDYVPIAQRIECSPAEAKMKVQFLLGTPIIMNLSTPIEEIPKIGPQYQKRLKRLGVKTIEDIIFHFPHRYEDFSNLISISSADNEIGKIICLQAKIIEIKNIRIFKRRMTITEAQAEDLTGKIKITWFNQPYLANTLKPGDFVFLAGKMALRKGKKYLSSPSYEKIPAQLIKAEESLFSVNAQKYDSTHIGRLIPIYPETEGISSRWLRFIIKPILTELKSRIAETLPEKTIKENNLLEIKKAIWQIHFPDSLEQAELAKKRFIFEELFNFFLAVLKEKITLAKKDTTSINIDIEAIKKFLKSLPFKLTIDQKKCAWQILNDMEKNRPMNRLLNGDVGSGKTIVAAMAILNATKAKLQTALMAPTEILAKQHFETINNLFKKYNLKIGLITGKENFINQEKLKRKDLIEKIKKGEVDILIGTHALVQKTVEFKKLALVVIDEQHRFGIEQRMNLAKKQNFFPHFLSMSATPIPRTLALTLYGDLDLSLIKEMPKGRKKIITKIIPPAKRKGAYNFIKKEIKSGRQVFVICPRIEPAKISEQEINIRMELLGDEAKASSSPTEALTEVKKRTEFSSPLFANARVDERNNYWAEIKAVKQEHQKLSKEIFPDLKIEMLHGKMKTQEKEKILDSFKKRKTNILVSTSLIEVGIDFPNASIMLIEGADRFGLAQLHQFRGRVGRGKYQSYCFLFSEFLRNPRLKAMVASQDGFELSEKDLKLRGPGDLTGQRQWGLPDFVMASLKNIELIEKTRQAAKEILKQDSQLKTFPLLREKIKNFQRKMHLE